MILIGLWLISATKDQFTYLNHPVFKVDPYSRYESGRYSLDDDLHVYNVLGPHKNECDCDTAWYRPNQTPKPIEGIWNYSRCKGG